MWVAASFRSVAVNPLGLVKFIFNVLGSLITLYSGSATGTWASFSGSINHNYGLFLCKAETERVKVGYYNTNWTGQPFPLYVHPVNRSSCD